ncbi:MAG: transposase [Bacteroidales bacterium]|nr:transposase [Bacteroidales bacterium]
MEIRVKMKITTKDHIKSHCAQSIQAALNATQYTTWERNCSVVSDLDFVNAGIFRCMTIADSGRHFLQTSEELGAKMSHSNYYVNMKSRRRTEMINATEKQSYKIVKQQMQSLKVNYLQQFSEFDDYTVEAADGHFVDHACHTQPSQNGSIYSAGFIYGLDLRLGLLRPLCLVTNGSKRSSEVPAFKKKIEALNKSEKAVNKNLYVYDKAIIDYGWWHTQKKSRNYMISLLKEKAVFEEERSIDYDDYDAMNIGVERYYMCSKGMNTFTVVEYRDPETGFLFKFITTLNTTVRPGAIANLYYKRWTIEKSFNNSKSNFKERKAWSPDSRALNNQMRFTAMAYNLMRVLEEESQSFEPEKIHCSEVKYTKELEKREEKANKVGRFVNPLMFKKRIMRISSYTIRAVQLAIYTKTTMKALVRSLSTQLVPKPT